MNTGLRYCAAFALVIGGSVAAKAYPAFGWIFGWFSCMVTVLLMGGNLGKTTKGNSE